ncbi:MAG: aldehyde dehydrogenase family protein [Cryobacterium sp.]|nr:aldehyde dehydrogenase family protein [Oligoflexia bacterium]
MENSQAKVLPAFPEVPKMKGAILINGEILTEGFASREVHSTCASGEPVLLGTTPNVDAAMLLRAVDAAHHAWAKGQGDWPTARMEDRINAVSAFRDAMVARRELVCRLLMWEIGKSWLDSQAEFDRTILYVNDTIEELKRLDRDSTRLQFAGGLVAQIRRAPLGVTLCMGPFNYPLNETFTTLIPALIMGNTVVVKLARFGQLLWEPLLEAFRDCFPKGVVNIINGLGREIVAPSIQSGKIDVLAFIGSSRVASQIKAEHPNPHRFRSILSLDAKNPAVVLADADIDNAVSECIKGSLSFNGQRCTALKMLFVHRSVAAEFTKKMAAKIDALPTGLPWTPGVQITPLPDLGKPAYLQSLIDDAVKKGATLVNPALGGKVEGTLFHPALLRGVSLDSRVANEEQFGPVIPIREFDSIEEVEDYIVHSHSGAQVSLFGRDPNILGGMIDRLANQVCRINLNSQCQRGPDVFPFTGRKDSAEGTLSVYDALRCFSIRSMVAAKQDSAGKAVVRGILEKDTSRFFSSHVVI